MNLSKAKLKVRIIKGDRFRKGMGKPFLHKGGSVMQKTIEQEIEEVLTELFIAYGKNLKYEKGRMKVYVKTISGYKDLSIPIFKEACNNLLLESKYFPTIAEILKAYKHEETTTILTGGTLIL